MGLGFEVDVFILLDDEVKHLVGCSSSCVPLACCLFCGYQGFPTL